tara:strand:- start:49 stop:426 length:378 start_codon:yes stop_codon:yes gene_type:complete
MSKIDDNRFFAILRESAGLYARAARAIEKETGEDYTRQAVKDRAAKHPEILKDINEQNYDIAEEGLHSLMRSRDEKIKLRSIEFYLKTKGKTRGYIERQEITGADGADMNLNIKIIENDRPAGDN